MITEAYNMDYGNNLIKIRQSIDLSQNQLAKQSGISQSAISTWETNCRHPSHFFAALLVKFFNKKGKKVSINYFRPEKEGKTK